jgi:hypothetical protein
MSLEPSASRYTSKLAEVSISDTVIVVMLPRKMGV